MSIVSDFESYLKEHPIYEKIEFGTVNHESIEPLTPLLVMSQAIIDSFINSGDNRISLIMPDDELNILPLIIAKYFSNLHDDVSYSQNIFDDIQRGQHVRMGKAVVEFDSIDNHKGTISIISGTEKEDRTKEINLIKNYFFHLYFEKTDAKLSSSKSWKQERKRVRDEIKSTGMGDIQKLKAKRTFLNKTIVVISPKNKARKYLDDLTVCGVPFSDVVSYGELKDAESNGKPYKLYNKGQLECLPAIVFVSKLSELNAALRISDFKEKVAFIVSTQDKIDEITDNTNALIKCLRFGIPFISFLREKQFDVFPQLSELGFEFWHWKPSTISQYDFSRLEEKDEKTLFSDFSYRVRNAAYAEYSVVKCSSSLLRQSKLLIRQISQLLVDADRELRQITYKMNNLHKKLSLTVSPVTKDMASEEDALFEQVLDIWQKYNAFYEGQPVKELINKAIDLLGELQTEKEKPKEKELNDYISNIGKMESTAILVVPNGYLGLNSLTERLHTIKEKCRLFILELSDFYDLVNKHNQFVDFLIVPWFDKNEYIRIKQTYCYKTLSFILYDFENSWRSGYIRRFDSCLPHEKLTGTAKRIGFSAKAISNKPVDQIDEDYFAGIGDYNFDKDLFVSVLGNNGTANDSSDSVEVLPVLFKTNEIGLFTPNHKMIDITELCSGESEQPVYKEASKLSSGNIVIIRESNRDIISEIADRMLRDADRYDLRITSGSWIKVLQDYAEGKSISFILDEMNKNGASCTEQQIRYWLLGETICPADKNSLIAIGKISGNDTFLGAIDDVFKAGAAVRTYHKIAGRKLTGQLKAKAAEITSAALIGKTAIELPEIGRIKILTVEDIFETEITNRARANRLEELS